jgi:hypothetical protein
MSLSADNSQSEINKAVSAVKSSTDLNDANQSPKYSGHESASYGNGPDKSAAVPGGSPGTGY